MVRSFFQMELYRLTLEQGTWKFHADALQDALPE